MNTPEGTVDVTPGSFVVHPPGELHEYVNGSSRTLLFRIRYGDDMASRHIVWRGVKDWKQRKEDAQYFAEHFTREEVARIRTQAEQMSKGA